MTTPDHRGWRWVALGVALLASGCAATSVVLLLVHQMVPEPVTYWVADVVCAVLYGVVAVLMLPRTRHPAVWILMAVALGCGAASLATQYVRLEIAHPGVPDGDLLWAVSLPLWILGTYSTVAVLPWLVAPGRPRGLTRVLAAVGLTAVLAAAVAGATLVTVGPRSNPFAIGWQPWQDLLVTSWMWPDRACVAVGALGLVRLLVVWWRTRGTAERGYGWFAVGQLLLVVALVPVAFLKVQPSEVVLQLSGASLLAAQAFLPVALLIVVLGQRLWGIDVAVSRLAVWLSLTGTVVAVYVAAVWVTLRLLPVSDQAAGLLAALVLALVAHPARLGLQRRVDAMVYGADSDPASMLALLGERLRQGRAAEALPALVEGLRGGLRLGSVTAVSREHPEVYAEASGTRSPGADSVVLPLVVEGRHVGDLTVVAAAGERLDLRTVRVVRDLSDLVAVALELEQTNRRLRVASERLGEVRHEERRMLRRELHDGLGPVLAGVALGLAAARRRLREEPDVADQLLAELETEVVGRSDAVRQLSRSLLPAQLDDGDLVGALRVLTRRFQGTGIVVRTSTDRLGSVGTKRQIAVYHVAAEALLNAVRHSGAETVTVSVTGGDGDPVRLEVVDDGDGIAVHAVRGVGLQSMRERADELAGTLEVTSGPDGCGTRVALLLP
ncbi:ATP-binding protein [Nocardioides sp. W7]|uniref:sensor histidine kinase n=1 Tax=Nocardioides sp. W7 TaxID=2931390 RepID=UPI001FD0D546|nr:ATP-binding protein [Nocardioides sp. W7]